MEEVQNKWICGFWRRIEALFIDTLILAALGYLLGVFLEDIFVQLGGWGRLVGFVISISYFGIMNSSLFNGQTIGKKVLNIQVVNASNSTISLSQSFFRYSFLAIPFSLNGAQINNEALSSFLIYPLAFIVLGGLLSILYLYIFNRVTRQSLHDLIAGTFVVNTDTPAQKLAPVWKPHLIIVTCLFITATLSPVLTSYLVESVSFKGLLTTQKALTDNDYVKYAGITVGSSTVTSTDSGTSTTTYVNSQAFLYQNDVTNTVIAQKLAQTIIKSYPEALSMNVIQVTLVYGYDIGIASKWHNYTYRFAPNEIEVSQ